LICEKEALVFDESVLRNQKAVHSPEKEALLFEKRALLFEKRALVFKKGALLFEKRALLFEKEALPGKKASLLRSAVRRLSGRSGGAGPGKEMQAWVGRRWRRKGGLAWIAQARRSRRDARTTNGQAGRDARAPSRQARGDARATKGRIYGWR